MLARPPAPRVRLNMVDLAYSNGVFHHIDRRDRADCLRFVRHALRPGGVFALWENNPWNPGARLVMRRIPFDRDAVLLTARQAVRLLDGAGLQPLAVDHAFIFPRALKVLRDVPAPAGFEPLADGRMLRLAAAASSGAALSSRQEVYPRGMEALRALRLARGALGGVRVLSAEQVRDRVAGRYPEGEPLPERPRLDEMLASAGLELAWDPDALDGRGGYVNRVRDSVSISSASSPPPRLPTGPGRDPREPISPEEADARQFEEKLRRSLKDGAFLTLMVPPRSFEQARRELEGRFSLRVVDGDRLIIDASGPARGATRATPRPPTAIGASS